MNDDVLYTNELGMDTGVPETRKVRKWILIGVGVVVALLVVILVVVLLLHLGDRVPDGENTVGDVAGETTGDNEYENLTKEEALEFIKKCMKVGCVPEGMLPEALAPSADEYGVKLLYSYDDVSEVPELAKRLYWSGAEPEDLIMTETEHYTIVAINQERLICGNDLTQQCQRGIAFNRKYLDYDAVAEDGVVSDVLKFNDLSENFVRMALPIVAYAGATSSENIYSFDMVRIADDYELTLNCVGVGVNLAAMDEYYYQIGEATDGDGMFAINLYRMKYALDAETGEVDWVQNEINNSRMFVYKSLLLSEQEVQEMQHW